MDILILNGFLRRPCSAARIIRALSFKVSKSNFYLEILVKCGTSVSLISIHINLSVQALYVAPYEYFSSCVKMFTPLSTVRRVVF